MAEKKRLYLDTSVWLRLMDRSDPARRRATRRFLWETRWRNRFLTSDLVRAEIRNNTAGRTRTRAMKYLSQYRARSLPGGGKVHQVTGDLLATGVRGRKGVADLAHLAYAIVHRADAVVTWNMKGMATPMVRKVIRAYCRASGWNGPMIGNPEEVRAWLKNPGIR